MFSMSPKIFLISGAIILTLFISSWLLYERNQTLKTLLEQSNLQLEACADNHNRNKEVIDEYHKKYTSMRNELADDKRLLKDSCLSIPTTARIDDPAPEGYVWKGQVSITDSLDYYAECGQIEIQLRSLQEWVNR